MVCKKCNFQNPSGMQYCGGCGAPLHEKKSQKKNWLIVALAVALVAVAVVIILMIFGSSGAAEVSEEQLELGYQYISDGNYEEAILAFDKVIEIDDKNVDAYIGKATAQSNIIDENTAQNVSDTLMIGYEKTNDDRIIDAFCVIADDLSESGHGEIAVAILNTGYAQLEVAALTEYKEQLEQKKDLIAFFNQQIGVDYDFYLPDDYDGDGSEEAFVITGQGEEYDGTTSYTDVEIYFINANGECRLLVSDLYGFADEEIYTVVADKYKFIRWEKSAGGSGSLSYVFGCKNGEAYEPKVSRNYEGFRFENGKYLADTSDYSKGYHDWKTHEFTFDVETCEFVEEVKNDVFELSQTQIEKLTEFAKVLPESSENDVTTSKYAEEFIFYYYTGRGDYSKSYMDGYWSRIDWEEDVVKADFKSIFGIDMPNVDFSDDETQNVIYKNGYYGVGSSDFGEEEYVFVGTEYNEEKDVHSVLFNIMWGDEVLGEKVIEIKPENNGLGFVVKSIEGQI